MPINNSNNKTQCCQTLLSLYGISLSQHLKETSLFHLPDLPTSLSCLSDFQSKLNSFSLSANLTSLCFDPLQFVITPNFCASIETTHDWVSKLGPSTSLDTACRPDLTDLTSCDACVAAGFRVQNQLTAIDGNKNHSTNCFYLTILYAAGIVNQFGPESIGAMSCILGLSISSQSGSSKTHLAMVFGLTGACVAAFVMSVLLGFYYCWHKKRGNKSDAIGFGLDTEELESRPRMRPNTGSIWFKIDELSKATENFSQKNFIGRGGFGVVYKGTLSDGTVVAVKQVIESDFQGNEEFCNEVEIISNLKHRNLVPLRGCCVTGEENGEYGDGESQRYLVYDYMPNGNLDDHLFWSEKQSMGTLWIVLCWERNSASSNPKAIMERFVLVGILCAHVMVALRPTILDALKMLEGDIEVPAIPDRPMPLGHPSFCRDGNTFSISPALSGPKLNSGDMLRSQQFSMERSDIIPVTNETYDTFVRSPPQYM
ncbi:putative receptor-like protein kinase [Camellia lanceoleosa]|uniref:Receptor-like protein kinase n=1 Tax=Camellia lanceoleosa TaxID=1840588 RepID=A0ACC0FSQ3_9ERIC|nr:putative receptor-like protein kinase [Camellia lanceoleosa]